MQGDLKHEAKILWSWLAAGALPGFGALHLFCVPDIFGSSGGSPFATYFFLQRYTAKAQAAPALVSPGDGLLYVSAAPVHILFAFRSPSLYFGRMNQKSLWITTSLRRLMDS